MYKREEIKDKMRDLLWLTGQINFTSNYPDGSVEDINSYEFDKWFDTNVPAKDVDEIINSYKWIKVPKFIDVVTLSWEQRFNNLQAHHIEETTFLIEKIRELYK